MTSSSSYLFSYASKARLNGPSSWVSATNSQDEWLQVNLDKPQEIDGIAIQGTEGTWFSGDKYLTSYQIYYQNTSEDEEMILWTDRYGNDKIAGATDGSEVARHNFQRHIMADIIRIVPITWESGISLRMELYSQQSC